MTVTTGTIAIGSTGSVTGISTLTTGTNGTFAINSGGTLTAGAYVNNNGYFISENGFSTNASMTFTGTGTVSGDYTHSTGTLGAGADGTAGILTFANGLTLSGGTVKLDINNPAGVGILGGANDELQVLGDLTLSSTPGNILVRILGSAPTAADVGKNFPIMSVGGTLNGLANLANFNVGATTRGNYTVIQDPTIPSQLDIHIAGLGSGGANLTWTGTSNANWDLNTSTNWVDSTGSPNTYFDGDTVNFISTGTGKPSRSKARYCPPRW